jgi:hypothetical protein
MTECTQVVLKVVLLEFEAVEVMADKKVGLMVFLKEYW